MKPSDPLVSRTSPRRKVLQFVTICLALLLLASACRSSGDSTIDATPSEPAPAQPTPGEPDQDASDAEPEQAPPMSQELAATIETLGNAAAEVVIVNTQGGPMPSLATDELEEVASGIDLERVLLVNVHQAQTLNPARFTSNDIDFEQATLADTETVDMLAKVVEYYKSTGKKVYVLGISFGAFVTRGLLASQGSVADGYLIEVGRLDMPESVWSEFADGRTAGFVDGVDVVKVPIEEAGMGAGTAAGDRNMARLAAGIGHKRFTELLADVDMSNVIYVTERSTNRSGV